MMAQSPVQKSGGGKGQAIGLMIVRIALGAYLLFVGIDRADWLLDSTPLSNQLSLWLAQSTPASRWYLERIMPGTPVFARLIPIGEMVGGAALILGFWTRLAAGLSFLVVLNLHVAAASIFKYAYLTSAEGLPLVGALLGLMIGGGRLPLSIRK
jgi:uncharacterized membrane protein YphA (DoxX/SURF4 family)